MNRDELVAWLDARPWGHYEQVDHRTYKAEVATITALTELPETAVALLVETQGGSVSAAERADFLLSYRRPGSLDDVRLTARELVAEVASARGQVAQALLAVELEAFPDAELAQLLQFARRNDIRLRSYAKKLGLR